MEINLNKSSPSASSAFYILQGEGKEDQVIIKFSFAALRPCEKKNHNQPSPSASSAFYALPGEGKEDQVIIKFSFAALRLCE